MEPKSIGEIVDEFRAVGPTRFAALYTDPVILLRDLGTDAEDEGVAFHTKFMSREEVFGSAAQAQAERPALLIGACVVIAKRDGAAFQDRIGVGRARNADVSLHLARISKYHAFFTRSADGKSFQLTDAGSKNGTFVDGKRIPEKQAVTLADGQEIAFGPYRFTFFTPEGFVDMVKRRAAIR